MCCFARGNSRNEFASGSFGSESFGEELGKVSAREKEVELVVLSLLCCSSHSTIASISLAAFVSVVSVVSELFGGGGGPPARRGPPPATMRATQSGE